MADAPEYKLIFDRLVKDPRYIANLDWGAPRPGHPEGSIRAHIVELERNLDVLRGRLSDAEYWKLKLLIHVHDTFKPDARPGVAISNPHSHASLARRFLSEYTEDEDLLAIVQNHDVPFALWKQFQRTRHLDRARLAALQNAIADWKLFTAFLIVDGTTAGKSPEPLRWFFAQLRSQKSPPSNDAAAFLGDLGVPGASLITHPARPAT